MWRIIVLLISLVPCTNSMGFDTCHYRLRADFVAADACPGQDIGLLNTSLFCNSHIRWQWNLGDGRHSDLFNPQVNYPVGGFLRKISLKAFDSLSNCRDSIQKILEVFPKPESEFNSIYKYFDSCPYRQFTAYNTNPIDHSFRWFLPDGDSIYITGRNYLILEDTFKVYQNKIALKVQSDLGCISITTHDYNLVGLENVEIPDLKFYSTANTLHIIQPIELKVQLFDTQGQLILSQNFQAGHRQIPDLIPGVYYLQIQSDKGPVGTYKVIVN